MLEGRDGSLQILDDLSTLGDRLAVALEDTYQRVVGRLLQDFVPRTEIPVARLLGSYFLGPLQGSPAPAAVAAVSAAAPAILEEQPAPVEEPETVGLPVATLEPPEEPVPAPEVQPWQELASFEDVVGELEPAGEPQGAEVAEPEIPALIGDFAQEIIPGAVALVGEDQEDILDSLISRIAGTLRESGLGSNDQELRDRLHEVSELEECSAMLADADGLVFLGEMDTVAEPDLVAALHVELVSSLRGNLEDAGLGSFEGIILDGGSSRLQVYPSVEGLSLVVHSGRPLAEREEEGGPSLPGEMALREAILKKALEGMARLDGVRGSLVSQREGLPIEFLLPEDLEAGLLASVLSQALAECEQFLDQLGMGPLRQALLQTGEAWYSLVPLGVEGVLVTVLDPETSRETWLLRLEREARMMASVLG